MMRTAILGLLALTTVTAPASATIYVPNDPQFTMLAQPGKTIYNSAVINGFLGVVATQAGIFTDDFEFTIPQPGLASGSITTTANSATSANDIEILSASFDGNTVPVSTLFPVSGGVQQLAGLTNVPIIANVLNTFQITYRTMGAGSYGGQLTFERAAIPEPASWATFLLGFGVMGLALRRRTASRPGYQAAHPSLGLIRVAG